MSKMIIYSTYKIVIRSKYINQREIRLHKRFYTFDFIFYNNTIFHSSNRTPILLILPMNIPYATDKKTVV
jgi:hypothetical protein